MGLLYINHLNLQQPLNPKIAKGSNESNDSEASNEQTTSIYGCKYCGVDFCYQNDLISKSFHGKTGQAYLFNNCVNIFLGPQSEKEMMTGKHIVVDIYCI